MLWWFDALCRSWEEWKAYFVHGPIPSCTRQNHWTLTERRDQSISVFQKHKFSTPVHMCRVQTPCDLDALLILSDHATVQQLAAQTGLLPARVVTADGRTPGPHTTIRDLFSVHQDADRTLYLFERRPWLAWLSQGFG